MTGELLTPRFLKLLECEAVIERHMTADDLRHAVEVIDAEQLYRERGFDTFGEYARGYWGDRWAKLLEPDQRRALVARRRAEGQSLRQIGDDLGVSPQTAANDLALSNAGQCLPDRIETSDGRSYPARRQPQALAKPDVGGGVSHPARYSDELLPVFADLLDGWHRVLDPFAGTGRIHELIDHVTTGVEIEPEWAELHPATVVGSALELRWPAASFDAICTSPTYGNRLADHHEASDPEARRSYRHDLGRPLHEDNSGAMQWGPAYRTFHERAWREAVRVLRPGGRFVLNIKDHLRGGTWQDVAGWHVAELCRLGLEVAAIRPVTTRSLATGSTADLRVGAELVIALDKANR